MIKGAICLIAAIMGVALVFIVLQWNKGNTVSLDANDVNTLSASQEEVSTVLSASFTAESSITHDLLRQINASISAITPTSATFIVNLNDSVGALTSIAEFAAISNTNEEMVVSRLEAVNTSLGAQIGLQETTLSQLTSIAVSVSSIDGKETTQISSMSSIDNKLTTANANLLSLNNTEAAQLSTQSSMDGRLATMNANLATLASIASTSATSNGQQGMSIVSPLTAFGELSVAQPTPIFQANFAYEVIHPQLHVSTVAGGGSAITNANSSAYVTSGTASTSYARLTTKRRLHYRTGQGGVVRFTAFFSTIATGATLLAGIGNDKDGFFFGYDGLTFGILHRSGGYYQIAVLTITAAATGAETGTVTIDGTTRTVALTSAGGSIPFTAFQIASLGVYSTLPNDGWTAISSSNQVIFVSTQARAFAGSFTFTSTGAAAGTFAITRTGRSPTERWYPQSTWNVETLNGTSANLMTLDPSMGNVFQIKYQWLGFGAVSFYVEDRESGSLTLVHRLRYAGTSRLTSVSNPSFPIFFEARAGSSGTAVQLGTPSMAMFIEGGLVDTEPIYSVDRFFAPGTVTNNVEYVALCIRNSLIYATQRNDASMVMKTFNIAVESNSFTQVRLILNPATLGAGTTANFQSWQELDSAFSIAHSTTGPTTLTGGKRLLVAPQGRTASSVVDLTTNNIRLAPGDVLCATVLTRNSASVLELSLGFNWFELR